MTYAMQLALVVLRLVQFASAMVLLGSPSFALALVRRLPSDSLARHAFEAWLHQILLAAAAVALVSAVLWLDLEAAIMGGGWSDALDPGIVGTVLFSTDFGGAWQWHLGIGIALLAVLLPSLKSVRRITLVAALGAAFVASLAWAGHAVMYPGPTQVGVMAIHMLAGGLWLGSLPALIHSLRLAMRLRTRELADALVQLLPRYSRAGYLAVTLVLLTGIANSAFLVDGIRALVTTAYGVVLLVKIVLVLIMVSIAAVNRFRLLPSIIFPGQGRVSDALTALLRMVALEQATAVLILGAVSLLGTLAPAIRH